MLLGAKTQTTDATLSLHTFCFKNRRWYLNVFLINNLQEQNIRE